MARRHIYVGDPPRCPQCHRGPNRILVDPHRYQSFRTLANLVGGMLVESGHLPRASRWSKRATGRDPHELVAVLRELLRAEMVKITKPRKASKCGICGHKVHGGEPCDRKQCFCGRVP
jgi:hypothetical protein